MRASIDHPGQLLILLLVGVCAGASAQPTPDIVWQATATNNYVLNPVAVSPDGAVAATLGADNTIQIWRMSNGVPIRTLSGHGLWVGDLAFSPDGTYLASGGGDKSVRVWRTADWSLAYAIPTVSQGPPIAFSPDSATLAVGNGTAIELRRATNGALFQSWTGTTGQMKALAFSPDGSKLASGAGYRGLDTALKFWAVPGGALIRSVPTAQTYSVGRLAFSPDGQVVVTGSEYLYSGPMQSWRVIDGSLLRTFPMPAYAMAFSQDGAVLAAAGTNILFFRTSDGALIQEYADGFASFTQGEKGIALNAGLFVRSRGRGEVMAGRLPVLLSAANMQNGQVVIRWVGGSGRYQLQRSSGTGTGWQNQGGVLTTNLVLVDPNLPTALYRVISLPP